MARILGNRDGLGPSHARLPLGSAPMTADAFVEYLISTQRHRHPDDDDQARADRFTQGLVRNGHGQILSPTDVVGPDDEIWFYRMPAEETEVPGRIRPVYSSPGVLVVDKPPFLATMPRGRHITQSATVRIRRATGNDDLVPAHRLDRQTSGLLLFTTAPQWRGAYQTMFAHRKVFKTYQAIAPVSPRIFEHIADAHREGLDGWHIHQRMTKTHGDIQARLEDDHSGAPTNAETVISSAVVLSDEHEHALRKRYADWPGDPLGERPHALYTMHPLSGKTHQLRLCLHSLGVPIVGDQVYPRILPEAISKDLLINEPWDQPLLLRSTQLRWTDPILEREVTVKTSGLDEFLATGL